MRAHVVLFNPASCRPAFRRFPLSIYALAAPLRAAGYDPLIVDGNVEHRDPAGALLAALAQAPAGAPILVGITAMPGPQLRGAAEASRAVRARMPAARIAWGGYFPGMHDEVCLRSGLVDLVARGRADATIVGLADAISAGGDGSGAPGMTSLRHGQVQVVPAPPPPPLDDVPQFDFTGVPVEKYLGHTYLGQRTAQLFTSYGCPWACNFCAATSVFKRRYQALSPDRVMSGLRSLHARCAFDGLEWVDMDFFVDKRRVLEIAASMPAGVGWWGYGRVDELLRFAPAEWEAMRRAGLKMIYFGAESGSDTVLARMQKDLTTAEVREVARVCASHGIVPELSFVLGNPVDPEVEIVETFEFIQRLKAEVPSSEIIIYRYTPMPQPGEMLSGAFSRGFQYPRTLEGWLSERWLRHQTMRDPVAPWITREMRDRIDGFELVVNSVYPSVGAVQLRPWMRRVMPLFGGWRYRRKVYRKAVELKILHRVLGYLTLDREGFPRIPAAA